MTIRNFDTGLSRAGRFAAPMMFAGLAALSAPALAQQAVPPSAALQSCSVGNAPCELNTTAGWFVGPKADARIEQYDASTVKPTVTTENRLAADGKTRVVTFKGANGKYLTIYPDGSAKFLGNLPTDPAAQFVAVPGLASPPGQSLTSFQSLPNRNLYLRHSSFILYAHRNDGSELFRRDATWRVLNAVQINAARKPVPNAKAAALPPGPMLLAGRDPYSSVPYYFGLYIKSNKKSFCVVDRRKKLGTKEFETRYQTWDEVPTTWCLDSKLVGGKEINGVTLKDGVLYAIDASRGTVWSSTPAKDPTALLIYTDQGMLQIVSRDGQKIYWESR
ncbi:AbfB domain-containing protein [Sphingomonas naphthae]|uniref:AbfB domain-containing protein n=1 Tax=Sphingomonas naphthae TaxID=1813468 RepID=A0ABY7TM39_9SPHN|nr:AbfB domain-containing protein [Sphingomonas naphthae]WCT74010.1 AbfB domain-containing protein [Sphingomonas naphthae]